jgi:hypothetical protein
MMVDLVSEMSIQNVENSLTEALVRLMQRCEEVRWRLRNFPIIAEALVLEADVDSLSEESANVVKCYGGLHALAMLEVVANRAESDCNVYHDVDAIENHSTKGKLT